jgi:hypothetical protein
LKLPGGQVAQGPIGDEFLNNAADFDSLPAAPRQVAGQPAQCFTMKGKTPTAPFTEATSCMTASGILVYMQAKMPSGDMIQEATSVSTSVSDADFQLPFPATEFQMPSFPGAPGGQVPPNIPGLPGGQLPPNFPRP